MRLTRTIVTASATTVVLSMSLAWAADRPALQSASPAPTASPMSEHHGEPAPSTPVATAMPMPMPMPMQDSGQMPMMMCSMSGSMMQMMAMNAKMGAGAVGMMSDQDFVLMTIVHDQMTIQMARAELQNGKDEKVKAAARSIISRYSSEVARLKALISP